MGVDGVVPAVALSLLSDRDPDLSRVLKEIGPPPMWEREAGFPTLVRIILEQQVSLASAKAAYDRLLIAASPLTPENFLELDEPSLKAIGFSRQKTLYCRALADSILKKQLNLLSLHAMDDEAAKAELLKIKGVGDWTADIYLLMALRRADVWPKGDLALAIAVQKVKQLELLPTPNELEAMSQNWRPWRAIAARILWHYYLSRREKTKSTKI